MARPRTINREHLLDVAEAVVSASGAAGLSFGAVAEAAGLSKASVQSVFGTRESLIEAMLQRWLDGEQQRFEAVAGPRPTRRERIQAHIQTTAQESAESNGRMAALMAALAGSGHQAESATRWYAARIGDLTARGREARRLRIAFLAAEGAFYMRHFAGVPLSDALWQDIFNDLLAFGAEAGQGE